MSNPACTVWMRDRLLKMPNNAKDSTFSVVITTNLLVSSS